SKQKSKEYYDNKIKVHDFKVNDLVYLQNKIIKPGLNKKLSPNFKGPYKILKVFPNRTVLLQIKNKSVRYHVNMLKPQENFRSKRNIFSGESHLFSWLFDTSNSNYAEPDKKSIINFLKGKEKTQLLMRQQLGIISNTITHIEMNANSLKNSENQINDNIENLNSYIIRTSSIVNLVQLQQLISEQISSLNNVFNDMNDYCESIISAIILAKNNILHTNVISPNELLIKLSQIQLHQSQKLPIELTKNTINEYYSILKISINKVENNIIFAIKIPIVESTTYVLYEVIPLPIPHNSSQSLYIEFISPYLIIDPSKTYYSQLQSLGDCSLTSPRNYNQNHPLSGSREAELRNHDVHHNKGSYTIHMSNKDYKTSNGILAFSSRK
ncbi:hypothetical protein PV325_013038, partial [Microctonus aethiopoides]